MHLLKRRYLILNYVYFHCSGFGYIVGSKTAEILKSWQWGLRVTPFAGIIAVLIILFVMDEPDRGFSEGRSHLQPTSWTSDVKILMKK